MAQNIVCLKKISSNLRLCTLHKQLQNVLLKSKFNLYTWHDFRTHEIRNSRIKYKKNERKVILEIKLHVFLTLTIRRTHIFIFAFPSQSIQCFHHKPYTQKCCYKLFYWFRLKKFQRFSSDIAGKRSRIGKTSHLSGICLGRTIDYLHCCNNFG